MAVGDVDDDRLDEGDLHSVCSNRVRISLPPGAHDEHVLEADAAEAGGVERRLDGEHHALLEPDALVRRDARRLRPRGADAVAGVVAVGRAEIGELGAHGRVDVAGERAGLAEPDRELERAPHAVEDAALLAARRPGADGVGAVRPVAVDPRRRVAEHEVAGLDHASRGLPAAGRRRLARRHGEDRGHAAAGLARHDGLRLRGHLGLAHARLGELLDGALDEVGQLRGAPDRLELDRAA